MKPMVHGSPEWFAYGERLIARFETMITIIRELGVDAANIGDIETGWYCDKETKQLQQSIADTRANIEKVRKTKGQS